MKRRITHLSLLTFILLTSLIFAMLGVNVSADGTTEGSVDSTTDETENYIWKATYPGGTEEYFDTFRAPFATQMTRDGAVYTLIPETYNLYMDDYVNISFLVDVTIDLRGKKIICPETKEEQNDINKHVFNCSSSNGSTITFLMEDAEFYAAHQGRTAIQMSGKGHLVVDGGVNGGKLFSPGGIHVYCNPMSDGKTSVIKNMYIYKPSGNMTGLISARQNGIIKIVDSIIVSPKQGWPTIYLDQSGRVILENTFAANIEGGQLITVKDTSTAKVEVHDGCYIYGTVHENAAFEMSFYPTTYYSLDLSRLATEDEVISARTVSHSFRIHTSEKVGSYTSATKKFTFKYALTEDMKPTKTQNAASIWRMERKDGQVLYTDKFYGAFKYASDYSSFTLLKDYTVERRATAVINGDFIIDLDGHDLTLKEDYSADYPAFIDLGGEGSLSVRLSGSKVYLPNMQFIVSTGIDSITLSATNSYLNAKSVIDAAGADIEIEGGYYDVGSGDAFATDKNVIIDAVTVVGNGVGQLIRADMNAAILNKTRLFTTTGACAVITNGKLSVSNGTYIYGTVAASELELENYAAFSHNPKADSINMIILKDTTKVAFEFLSYDGIELKRNKKTYSFGYISTKLDDGMMASFTMSEDVALNIYIPTAVVKHGENFLLRLSIDGLLMEVDSSDGKESVIGNRAYTCFKYPYVYPASYYSDVNLTMMAGSQSVEMIYPLNELFGVTLSLIEDEGMKSAVATYCTYAARSSGKSVDADSDIAANTVLYRETGSSGELFKKLVRSVSFDVEEQKATLYFAEGFTGSMKVSYKYGDSNLTYEATAADGSITLPVYRLSPYDKVEIVHYDSGSNESVELSIYDIISFTDKDSLTGEYLRLLGAYMQSLAGVKN